MSGSSLDGLDLVFAEFHERGGKWTYALLEADCIPYSAEWARRLSDAVNLSARDYLLLHAAYGHYNGKCILDFIEQYGLHHRVQLVASHGHTVFHLPAQLMTAQLGEGAAIAAVTGLPVVGDLRALDVALGGQGAPIVPMGEKLLFAEYGLWLNIGGIANMTYASGDCYTAFDICPANQVLNRLAARRGQPFDMDGQLAANGLLDPSLLEKLDALPFYQKPAPRSLDNLFSVQEIMPIIEGSGIAPEDALHTYSEHIARQVIREVHRARKAGAVFSSPTMLVTGGGALNRFLVSMLGRMLEMEGISLVVPDEMTIRYKEALIMAFLGILRWREQATTLPGVTGASRGSIGGAVWMGTEA